MEVYPDLTTQVDAFYELGCADQPPGFHGVLAHLDLGKNAHTLLKSLDVIFEDPSIPSTLRARRRAAYGHAYFALGLLASSLTGRQLVAALLCFSLLTGLLLLGPLSIFVADPAVKAVMAHLNLFDHMESFSRGIVDTRHVVYHLSLVLLSLTAATKALEQGKWR